MRLPTIPTINLPNTSHLKSEITERRKLNIVRESTVKLDTKNI